ncbi:hypothetical protein MUK42_36413 [Musa troglodytarum]|uniref:HMA domain-containing protein n=1 Tax=Musa troglodytarum TaxID=320322 RepID=A0A9E7GI03_9LILI|nr:hypothetical protein MUK42_36413 [Musa troglodytarum]
MTLVHFGLSATTIKKAFSHPPPPPPPLPLVGISTKAMAEKISTVIIKVDLDCCLCSKKIKKALCKLQKRFKIQSIVYVEKKNTVIVSGPFNPECLIKKLCCLACKLALSGTGSTAPRSSQSGKPHCERRWAVVQIVVC